MASVTLNLGAPTHSSAAFVQWDVRSAPDALGDISVLSADDNPRKLVRIRIFNSGRIQLQTIQAPDGTSGFATSEELSATWESSLVAIKLRRLNGTTLQLGGPNSSVAVSKDTTEPYAWSLTGAAQLTAIQAFFSTYSTNLFAGAASVTLDDGVVAHAVNPGDVSFEFRTTVSRVTRTLARRHAVDAGDVSFSFQTTIPAVTRTQPERHSVNPGDVSFSFRVSQPAVTHIDTHALSISQFRQSGLKTPVVLALIESTITNLGVGTQITRNPAVPVAGSLVISSSGFTSATIGRVLRHNANMNIQLLKTTSGAFWQFFNTGGAYQYAKLYIQTADAFVQFNAVNHGGGFSNWRIADSTQWSVITGIQTGDRFLFAIAVPGAMRAVDAGDVSFSFSIAQPRVTLTTFALSTSQFDQSNLKAPIVLALLEAAIAEPDITVSPMLAIGTGDLLVSSPGITSLTLTQVERHTNRTIRLRQSGGTFSDFFNSSNVYGNAKLYIQTADEVVPFVGVSHGGGYSNWRPEDASQWSVISGLQTGDRFLLALAQPLTIYAVDAGDVSFTFSIAQPQITLAKLHAVDAGDVSFSFHVSQPTVTVRSARAHAVDAGDVSFEFRISILSVTKLEAFHPTISTRLRPIPSNNRYAYQVSPNRAVPQLALTPDIFMSIPGKLSSLGERIFPFSGLVINSDMTISGARWRRDSGAWTNILLGDFTDIVSAIRFYSEILNEYGEFIYDLDVVLGRGANSVNRIARITVQSKILLGLPKTTDVDVRYKPFSDAHIATDKTQIRSIKYSAKGDEIINRTVIERHTLYSGEHDGSNNSLVLVSSGMDFTGLNIRLGQDILKNVTIGSESIITAVTATTLATLGSIEWDRGNDYEILDGASLDIIARGFELSHSNSGLYILTLHVEDRAVPSNESSASVSVIVD